MSAVTPVPEAVLGAVGADALVRCEERLRLAVADGLPGVTGPAADTLAAGGKRLRPLLVFCCAPAGGREDPGVVRAAAAVELVHMATLVHDDLIDGAPLRRGRPTVASAHGPATAVQVGDFLFARAFSELAGTGDARAVQVLAATALDLSLGELAQGRAAHDLDLEEQAYLSRCRRKTASLFAAACRLGALVGGAGTEAQERLARFGAGVGMAFQIFDDILDLAGSPGDTGKRRGADLRDGTVTLPVILALRAEPGLAGALRRAEGDADLEALCDRIAVHPGTAEARARALDLVADARAVLEGPLDGADRGALAAIADGVVDRYA
ncbi:MAG TPA: polyprenyl synthetase family protein [Miltoncostaeaceae bacterium]|nr:polyprenyl synthetase family protein [Miltoncostaeaceae bacterium]